MKSLGSKFNLRVSCFILVSTVLAACTKSVSERTGSQETSTPVTQGASPPKMNGGGGIDGSGGDTIQSTAQQVQEAFDSELKKLKKRIEKIESVFNSSDEVIYDFRFGNGAYGLVRDFLLPNTGSYTGKLNESLKLGNIKIELTKDACQSKDGDHAGSAKGDLKNGEICISSQKLQTVPAKILNEEIFLLLVHELSHLSGFDEPKAKRIQGLLSYNREIYSEYSESGFNSGIISCELDAIRKEVEDMERSSYWQEQMGVLLRLLDGKKTRICGPNGEHQYFEEKIDIFADDAEFLWTNRKFQRHGYRTYSLEDGPREPSIKPSYDYVQEITVVAAISLNSSTVAISQIPALVGTNAQCSPKILLANLIASVQDILDIRCGTKANDYNTKEAVKQRIKIEQEILRNAPH